jgi:molybdopterin/thiamine biosynthesis adenylyltransferase/rhodanese-related sulfurtransferase
MTMTFPLNNVDMERYARHLALPEFGIAAQGRLKSSHILVVGAGGLGAAALPYLAGAGIGAITICDDDMVSLSNLHRQTIYTAAQGAAGDCSKADAAAAYMAALNPDITIHVIKSRFDEDFVGGHRYDLILDGSDNFKTKTALNLYALRHQIPLIAASVNQFQGQCGVFAGHEADAPCYHCLFPELPHNARNCNEAGVLGTAAGLTGLYQAHLAILYLAALETNMKDNAPQTIGAGYFLGLDFKTMRNSVLRVPKNSDCRVCRDYIVSQDTDKNTRHNTKKDRPTMIELLSLQDLQNQDHIIVDVRTPPELSDDPIAGALHIELKDIPARYHELPQDKLLAFVCAGNVRSRQAAEYLAALGFDNVAVLDKFSL